MAVPYTYVNAGLSKAAAGRTSGEASLTVTAGEGVKFGSPSADAPLKLAVWRSGVFVTLLRVTGVSGDVLTIDGTADGASDAAVNVGDDLIAAATKGDFEGLWTAIGAVDVSAYAPLASPTFTGVVTINELTVSHDSGASASTISTSATDLTIACTGDMYGTVRMSFQNRNGSNGVTFENVGVPLVDFAFLAGGERRALRYETRAGQTVTGGPEFLFFQPLASPYGVPNAVFGDGKTFLTGGTVFLPQFDGSTVGGGIAPPVATFESRGGAAFNTAQTNATTVSLTLLSHVVGVDTSSSAVAVPLPASAPNGQQFVVCDRTGGAAANNVTVSAPSGGSIDGAASAVINTAFGSLTFVSWGSNVFTVIGRG